MSAVRIIEAVDVLEDGGFGLATGFPIVPPDQLGLDCFEEGFNRGVIVAIAFAAHRYLEGVSSGSHVNSIGCPYRCGRCSPWAATVRRAIFNALIVKSRFMRLLTAQPITRRECKSKITARYSHPSRVQM